MFKFSKKPIVVYLAYEPFGFEFLNKFLKNYKKYSSGYDHELIICFKCFYKKKLIDKWERLINVKYTKYYDTNEINDYDIGSYFRIAKKYHDRHILFLGSHTYPITKNWLKIFINHYEDKSLLGSTASLASIPSMFFNFFFDQYTKLQQLRWGLKHLLYVKLFPNPHIRTTGFFIKAQDLLSLNYDLNKFKEKINTNYFESGRKGLSRKLLDKGFKLKVVNSDNKSFHVEDWKYSQTFCLGDQKKLIFSDNRTNEYNKSSLDEKKKRRKFCWGFY